MQLEEEKLRDLLSGEAVKEKRAYKRASLFTTLAAVVGVAWLAFSASNVYTLQRKSSQLSAQILEQTLRLHNLQDEANTTTVKLDETTKKLSAAKEALESVEKDVESTLTNLKSIASGNTDPKVGSQQAIRTLNNASKTISGSRTTSERPKPLKLAPTPTPQASPLQKLSQPPVTRARETEPAKKKGKKGGDEP